MKPTRHIETHRSERVGWLRAAVLGANDGIVSVAGLVVGIAASGAPQARVRAIIQPKSKTAPAEDTAPALQLQPTPGMRSAP